jgi:uncharacterized LabA/DUF88 family protein
MEKIAVFLDYANINAAFRESGNRPEYDALLHYVAEGRFLLDAYAFVPIDPRNPHGRDRDIESLWQHGYLVSTKTGTTAGDSYKCDLDIEITLALMETAETARPDIIVLLSGDKDFVPVILALRKRGIRVEVGAFAGINAAREVMLKASGFIELEQFLLEQDQGSSPEPAGELVLTEASDEPG